MVSINGDVSIISILGGIFKDASSFTLSNVELNWGVKEWGATNLHINICLCEMGSRGLLIMIGNFLHIMGCSRDLRDLSYCLRLSAVFWSLCRPGWSLSVLGWAVFLLVTATFVSMILRLGLRSLRFWVLIRRLA